MSIYDESLVAHNDQRLENVHIEVKHLTKEFMPSDESSIKSWIAYFGSFIFDHLEVYNSKKLVVDDLSLNIRSNEIFALLGHKYYFLNKKIQFLAELVKPPLYLY